MVPRRSPKHLAPESYNLLGTGNCRARKIGRWKIFHGNTNGCSSPMRMNALRRIWNAKFARPLPAPDVDGFYLNRRFWFLDGWINHCGYFPSWNLRLFRHRVGRYEQIETGNDFPSGDNEVHEHVLLDGRVEYLSTPMEHYAFPDIATFIEKHERYSSWEAAARRKLQSKDDKSLRSTPLGTGLERKRWLKNVATQAPFRPGLRFLYHYIWRQGFRDGYRGLVLCRLLAGYERMIVSKECEMKKRTGNSTAAL